RFARFSLRSCLSHLRCATEAALSWLSIFNLDFTSTSGQRCLAPMSPYVTLHFDLRLTDSTGQVFAHRACRLYSVHPHRPVTLGHVVALFAVAVSTAWMLGCL